MEDLKQSDDDNLTKLKKVIDIWKDTKSSSVTWETMITAIESPVIDRKEIADEIRQHLKSSKLSILSLLLSNEVVFIILSLLIKYIGDTFGLTKCYHSVVEDFDIFFY